MKEYRKIANLFKFDTKYKTRRLYQTCEFFINTQRFIHKKETDYKHTNMILTEYAFLSKNRMILAYL